MKKSYQTFMLHAARVVAFLLFFLGCSPHHAIRADCWTQVSEKCRPSENDYVRQQNELCLPQRNNAERYILQQIEKGEPAKLADRFPLQTGRIVSGCFITALLTGSIGKTKTPLAAISIDGADIKGPVDLRNAEVLHRVELTCCTFANDVDMRRSHFTKGLSMAGSSFGSELSGPGRLDLRYATIDSDFMINDCKFQNCSTYFNGLKVARDWFLRRVSFTGVADFTGASAGGNFFVDKEHPEDPPSEFHDTADFEGIRVELDAGFSNVKFDGYVNFDSAQFSSMSIANSVFAENVNFKSSKIASLYLGGKEKRAKFLKNLSTDDMAFAYMSPEDWDELGQFARESNNAADESNPSSYSKSSNAQMYASIEELFRKHGHLAEADEVFIEGKRKERDSLRVRGQHGSYWNILFIPWGHIQDWSIGYGRHLARLLIISIGFLIVGFFVFRREAGMETKKPDDTERYAGRYSGFWYNVDLFLPIIELGASDIWTPKDDRRWAIRYKRLHIIAGHLLVPIGLAAWTGIIK